MVKGAKGAKVKVIFQGLHMTHGIFTIRVPFFGHMTQGLCFFYFPNIEPK